MAKIKYDPSITPLNKEHYGYTFQRNNYGFSMFPASKSARKRYPLQWEKMHYMSKAIRQWRNMSAETVNAWNVFASTFPQPTEKDPDTFLTGYQLFLKRNFYRFLHEGLNFEFLSDPRLSELPVPGYSISILEDGMCVDVTEEYIRNFGILPQVGQFIICRIIPMATNSGQFFAPFIATLEVQAVYLDGLICSFNFPAIVENIVFSLYMSKPVWESSQFAGTKFRYMGCFKPTQFIQLTDTPETYEGEAGKVVSVKEDETGLEFTEGGGCEFCLPDPATGSPGESVQVNPAGDGYELAEGGGGGLTCVDLIDCGIIETIINQVDAISNFLSEEFDTSIPPITLGRLYNWHAVANPSNICPVGWHIPTREELLSVETFLGGRLIAGGKLKETGLSYWNTPNTGATNSAKFNFRGAGIRVISGAFTLLYGNGNIWTSTPRSSTTAYDWKCKSNSEATSFGLVEKTNSGKSLRPVKDSTSLLNGETGTYTGNDNKVYRTICIDNLEFVADNLAESNYRDGTIIPIIENDSLWESDTEGACCFFNNDSLLG